MFSQSLALLNKILQNPMKDLSKLDVDIGIPVQKACVLKPVNKPA